MTRWICCYFFIFLNKLHVTNPISLSFHLYLTKRIVLQFHRYRTIDEITVWKNQKEEISDAPPPKKWQLPSKVDKWVGKNCPVITTKPILRVSSFRTPIRIYRFHIGRSKDTFILHTWTTITCKFAFKMANIKIQRHRDIL